MDAAQALADLTEISSQVQAAVIFDDAGKVAGTTLADAARAENLARRGAELLQHAETLRGGTAPPTQLEVATNEGSVFVVRADRRRIVATTGPQPTTGLVFYDLKSALRQIDDAPKPPPRKRRAAPKAAEKTEAPKKPRAPRKKPAPRKNPDAS